MAWSDEPRTDESDADALIRRSALEQARGNLKDAESLLTRALELREAAGGAHDEELPILLRELSRICIQQSAHDRAERPLLRLLAITEAQGQGKPEVATVLSTLASVRHALGDYASAERLYRKALRIRERALAPNHMTTAATLESLAETCAARGRFSDAVALRKRAAEMRETTLGANHASVRVARKRIADLQLEAQEVRRASTPPRAVPSVQSMPSVPPPPSAVERPLKRNSAVDVSQQPAAPVPWVAELLAVREEIESTSIAVEDGPALGRGIHASAQGTRSPAAIAAATGLALLLAGLGFKAQFGGKSDQNGFVLAEPFNPATQIRSPAAAGTKVPPVGLTIPSDTLALASIADVAGREAPDVRTRVTPPSAVKRELPRAPAPVARELPRVSPPRPRAPEPQSTKSATPAPVPTARAATPVVDSVPSRPVAPVVEQVPETRGRSESANAPVSPTLIGAAPEPQYPDALRDQQIAGDVVVQYVVDETGRVDVSSMTVVRSPHVLLTNAVRAVLPQLRYEPARTAPPRSIPRPETVRHTFTFRAPRR